MGMNVGSKRHVVGIATLGASLMALTGCGAAQSTPLEPTTAVANVAPANPDVKCKPGSENVGNRNAKGTYGNVGDDNLSSCNVGDANFRDDNVGNINHTENNVGNDNGHPRRRH